MSAQAASGGQGVRDAPRPRGRGFIRRKGNIGPSTLSLLLVAASLPLVLAYCRILAFPGADAPALFGLDQLRELGSALNESLSLRWVPPADRSTVLYLLLLPTAALLVALARLTFGLRVLGLRAILIAIGFQEIGFLPSFALMLVVIAAIVAVRPSMRRMGLPLYARLPVILCVCASIMVGALLIGPWVQSETVWSVAFFPVIIMAMLAESVAKTLADDNAVEAAWRAACTIALAVVLAVIGQTTAVGAVALNFPELLLTETVAIVFIAEFFDLRLLQAWPARLSRFLTGVRPWYAERPRVAVVRNRWRAGVIGRLGPQAPAKYRRRSAQPLVDALREQGFAVRVFEGDTALLRQLAEFVPPDPRTGAPGGIVLNLATGVQGNGRFCHVPAMLEMAGVAYTGLDPVAQAHLLDRYALMTLLHQAGVRVPRFSIVSDVHERVRLGFPIAVRPRFEPGAARVVVTDAEALESAVREVLAAHGQDAFLERVVEGREVRVALLGNASVECLPLLEYSPTNGHKTCPAPISDRQSRRVRDCAYAAYRASGCRDYARIDVRLNGLDEPTVIGVEWAGILAPHGSFSRAAEAAGYSFGGVLKRIIDEASLRYLVGARVYAAGAAADARPVPAAAVTDRSAARLTVEASP